MAELSAFSDEALLRELLRRHPRHGRGPTIRTPADREYVLPIGRDHHCVVGMWEEAAVALGKLG